MIDLLLALQSLPACRELPSSNSGKNLLGDLLQLNTAINNGNYNVQCAVPLLTTVLHSQPDYDIWTEVYKLLKKPTTAAEARPTTPPPAVSDTAHSEMPWSKLSNYADSTGGRINMDTEIKAALQDHAFVDHPNFFENFFNKIPQWDKVTTVVFEDCCERKIPLFQESTGWVHWPAECKEAQVLEFLRNIIDEIACSASKMGVCIPKRMRCITSPNKHLTGSDKKRKLDFALASHSNQELDQAEEQCHDWSHILVPGELKSNPKEARSGGPLLDLARYVLEIFGAQPTRRFVLGFTLCGPMMRILEFDRTGMLGSELFDINKDARRFVSVILGLLSMTDEQLGFDPTIKFDPTAESSKRRWIDIKRNDQEERIFLERAILPQPSLIGRATTCWCGFAKYPRHQPLIIKDSWEYVNRPHEGLLLEEAAKAGVNNVARYYWHEDVHVNGTTDDVQNNVRGSLHNCLGKNALKAVSFRPGRGSTGSPTSTSIQSQTSSKTPSMGPKRSSNSASTSAVPPPTQLLSRLSIREDTREPVNRVHRRVIMSNVGKPLYHASSLRNMLTGLLGGIRGELQTKH